MPQAMEIERLPLMVRIQKKIARVAPCVLLGIVHCCSQLGSARRCHVIPHHLSRIRFVRESEH